MFAELHRQIALCPSGSTSQVPTIVDQSKYMLFHSKVHEAFGILPKYQGTFGQTSSAIREWKSALAVAKSPGDLFGIEVGTEAAEVLQRSVHPRWA